MNFLQPFPSALYDLLEQSLPFYNMLRQKSRRTGFSLQPSLPLPSLPVPANEKLLAWVGDELLPRESAKVFVNEKLLTALFSVHSTHSVSVI